MEAAGDRGKPRGAPRHDRRGEVGARRLHADADIERPHHRGRHQQEPAVRSAIIRADTERYGNILRAAGVGTN